MQPVIRNCVYNALVAHSTIDNVYKSRVYPHDQLPCATVYVLRESVEPDETYSTTEYIRHMEVTVEIRALAATGARTTVDDLSDYVEYAVIYDTELAQQCMAVLYRGVEVELDDELERPAVVARMTFECIYKYQAIGPNP